MDLRLELFLQKRKKVTTSSGVRKLFSFSLRKSVLTLFSSITAVGSTDTSSPITGQVTPTEEITCYVTILSLSRPTSFAFESPWKRTVAVLKETN